MIIIKTYQYVLYCKWLHENTHRNKNRIWILFYKINKLFYEQISEGKKIMLLTFSTESDTAEVT